MMAKENWSERKLQLFDTFRQGVKEINPDLDVDNDEIIPQLESVYDSLPEEWLDSLESNPAETTTEYLKQLSAAQEDDQAAYAAKGAKLKMLKSTKKCSCGCRMVDKQEAGGKMTSTCACGCGGSLKAKKHEQGGRIQKFQSGNRIQKWLAPAASAVLATTKMFRYLPLQNALGAASQTAIGQGQLALGAAQSAVPAVVGETGIATTGGAAASGLGLGTLLAVPAAVYGGGYLMAKQESKNRDKRTAYGIKNGFGSGNIYNPRTRIWEYGTRDINYDKRAKNYETQPFSTTMNQRRSDLATTGKWDKETIKGHKIWNDKTQATAKRQTMLNTYGPGYKLNVNNKWDNATREADKNYTVEMLKPDILQENSTIPKNRVASMLSPRELERESLQRRGLNKNTPINKSKEERTKEWQTKLGVEVDGKWGKNTENAYQNYLKKEEGIKKEIEAKTKWFKQGGKVNRIAKAQKGGTDETWTPDNVGTGNKSMNPKDWTKSKEELKFEADARNKKVIDRIKPKEFKVNDPIKNAMTKAPVKGMLKEKGGKVKDRLKGKLKK